MASTHTGKSRSSVRKAPPVIAAVKPASTPKAAPKAAPKAKKITVKSSEPVIDSQKWNAMVATAAYFRAESRGFMGGSAERDWMEAEAEVAARFAKSSAKKT